MLELSDATKNFLDRCRLDSEDRIEVSYDDEGEKFRFRLYYDLGDGIQRQPSWQATYFPRAFPEKKKIGGHNAYIWEFPGTLQNVEILNYIKARYNGQMNLTPMAEVQADIVSKRNKIKGNNAHIIARWREHKKFPLGTKHKKDHDEHPLKGYQKIGRHCVLGNDGFALYMEQGTGKTPIMISAMMNMALQKRSKDPNSVFRVLVVCPKNVRYNWQEELDYFSICDHRTTVIRGGEFEREKSLLFALLPDKKKSALSVTVCSYGSLSKSVDAFSLKRVAGKKIKVKWDMVILDESHYIKTPRAQRTKAAFELRDAAERRYVLTGTPMTNTLLDIWAQLEFLGKGYSGFTTFSAFREFYGVYKLDQMGHKRLADFQNIPLLQETLAKTSFIITKKEALPDLPEKVYDAVEVSMTKAQTDAYVKVATQIFLEAEQELQDAGNDTMQLHCILTKMLRLSQVTGGFLKYDDEKDDDGNIVQEGRIDRFDPNPKLETLVEILKEKTPEQKTIVWANYKQDIKTICARLKLEGIETVSYYGETSEADREDARKRFNTDPNLKVLVGNSAAGGTGLNLLGFDPKNPDDYETYCDHVIYFSQGWGADKRSQSEDRVHRRGIKCNIRITDLVVPGTIDEEIRHRVRQKRKTASELQDVRQILNTLAGLKPIANGDS